MSNDYLVHNGNRENLRYKRENDKLKKIIYNIYENDG